MTTELPAALHQTHAYPCQRSYCDCCQTPKLSPMPVENLGTCCILSAMHKPCHAMPYTHKQSCGHRSRSDCTTLQRAIAQYLETNTRQPDKPANTARYHVGGHAWRPVWRKNDLEEAGDFYTIRVVKGQRQVIKRRSAEWYPLSAICMPMSDEGYHAVCIALFASPMSSFWFLLSKPR